MKFRSASSIFASLWDTLTQTSTQLTWDTKRGNAGQANGGVAIFTPTPGLFMDVRVQQN